MTNESIQNLHPGDRFDFKGLEWVVLDPDIEGGVLAITAEQFYRSEAFSDKCFAGCNDWRKSTLRNKLRKDLLPHLGSDNLIYHTVDLVADNGDKLYGVVDEQIFLLTCDEYRKYRDVIPQYDHWMWTCTPWITTNTGDAVYVRSVYSDGALSNYGAGGGGGGVAPACIFNPQNLKLRRQAQFVESPTQDK